MFVCIDRVYHVHPVMFMGFTTLTDLVILDMEEFDFTLRMICLSPYHNVLDCFAKTITVAIYRN